MRSIVNLSFGVVLGCSAMRVARALDGALLFQERLVGGVDSLTISSSISIDDGSSPQQC